jgi:hypothetical protein
VSTIRDLDRAAERRWPKLFRDDLRQALALAMGFQVVAMLIIFFSGDASAMPAVALLGGTVGLLTRVLLKQRKDAASN